MSADLRHATSLALQFSFELLHLLVHLKARDVMFSGRRKTVSLRYQFWVMMQIWTPHAAPARLNQVHLHEQSRLLLGAKLLRRVPSYPRSSSSPKEGRSTYPTLQEHPYRC